MKGMISAALILGIFSISAVYGADAWNYNGYETAFQRSGRKGIIDERAFLAMQDRKERALNSVEEYLMRKLGQADSSVLNAFREVPREYFMYDYERGRNLAASGYEVPARSWGIGYGSALSDYLGQAYMTQIVQPKPTDVVLEIGTGSGFQIALLSRIVKESYSIEIISALGNRVSQIFSPLEYKNVHTRVGDGFYGWPEVKDGFDIIIVTCAASYVPPPLLQQLKRNGRMIIPIGQPYKRGQFFYIFTKDQDGKVHSKKDINCYFIPMTGQIQKQ